MEDSRLSEIRSKVTVPDYFYNIIMPQMGNYYNDYTVDFDLKPVVKCPLHDEDTPSFRYYEDTNTFFCFGCRAGGDIINLHRLFIKKINGSQPTFSESIEFLYKFFVRGNNAKIPIKRSHSKQIEPINSLPEDLARLNNYVSKVERQLLHDNSINQDSKLKIWMAIDSIDLLINKNLINAIDAINYLKNIVDRKGE